MEKNFDGKFAVQKGVTVQFVFGAQPSMQISREEKPEDQVMLNVSPAVTAKLGGVELRLSWGGG